MEKRIHGSALTKIEYTFHLTGFRPRGFTDTPMTNALLGLAGFRDAFEKEIPLGRLSTIEDIAAATAWVCSDEAYMTGQNLQINGGLSLRRLPTMKELGLT